MPAEQTAPHEGAAHGRQLQQGALAAHADAACPPPPPDLLQQKPTKQKPKPKQQKPKPNVVDDEHECSICLDPVVPTRKSASRLECGHCFHRACINRWFRQGPLLCPMCRTHALKSFAAEPKVSLKMRALERTFPPGATQFYAGWLEDNLVDAPGVAESLGFSQDDISLVVSIATQTFTQKNFHLHLRAMRL